MRKVAGMVSSKTVKTIAFMVVAILAIVLAGPSSAQTSNTWRSTPDDTWMTNGTIFDTQLSEDRRTLYIGGRFTVIRESPNGAGVAAANLAAVDVATGEPVRTWRPRVGGEGAVVRELEVANGRVYIGGNFNSVNGTPRSNLAAVSATNGALDLNLDPVVARRDSETPLVFALEADDSRLYVGGRFQLVDGWTRPQLAAFDLDSGALDAAWRPQSTREVFDLELAPDRATIFVAGRFSGITGSGGAYAPRRSIARLVTETGDVHPWAVPAGAVSGEFQTAQDVTATRNRLYAGFGDRASDYVTAFALDNGNTGNQLWRVNAAGDVQAIALSSDGSRLFFGGHFGVNTRRQSFCDRPVQGLFSLNPASGTPYCDWNPRLQPEVNNTNGTWDITPGGGRIWIGGGFTRVAGADQTNLARFSSRSVNRAPIISRIGDQRIRRNGSTRNIRFSVSDPDSGPRSLRVSVRSSNARLVPASRIRLVGNGGSRTVRVVPARNQVGKSRITLIVTDPQGLRDTSSFVVTR